VSRASLGGAIATYAVRQFAAQGGGQGADRRQRLRRVQEDRPGQARSPGSSPALGVAASWTVEDTYSPERWIGSVAPSRRGDPGQKDPVVPSPTANGSTGSPENEGFWKVEGTGTHCLLLPDVRAQFLGFSNPSSAPPSESAVSPLTADQGAGSLETGFQFHSARRSR